MDKFEVHKPHKTLDWLEGEMTDWAIGLVTEHFGVEEVDTMSREQIDEVIAEWGNLLDQNGYDWLALGLRNVISIWENENDEYLIFSGRF
tara:strand:- start:19556 stop:19825 length:270 start_codon:yes stop_codon:yes gene_type:complete